MRTRTLIALSILFLLPTLVLAQGTPIPNYQPLEPLPFLSGISKPSFAQLMSGLFQLAMVAGAVLAVLMITYGGIQYMTSDVLGTKEAGRSRIKNAVLGFLLLLAIYIILYTINPQLLDFNLSSIKNVGALFQTQYPSTTNTTTGATTPTTGGGGAGSVTSQDGSLPSNINPSTMVYWQGVDENGSPAPGLYVWVAKNSTNCNNMVSQAQQKAATDNRQLTINGACSR